MFLDLDGDCLRELSIHYDYSRESLERIGMRYESGFGGLTDGVEFLESSFFGLIDKKEDEDEGNHVKSARLRIESAMRAGNEAPRRLTRTDIAALSLSRRC